jgi:hypothetical protein
MPNSYDVGQLIRIFRTFTLSGALTDPTTQTLEIKEPDGTLVSKTEADVTKDDVGEYHYDYGPVTQEGRYSIQWAGTGGVVTALTSVFWVREDLAD